MKKVIFALCAAFSTFLAGCKYYSYGLDDLFYRENDVENRAEKLKALDNVNSSGTYEILVLTDVHFGGENQGNNGERKDSEFLDWIEENYGTAAEPKDGTVMPDFAVCLGDVAEHGLEEEFEDYKKFTDELESRFGIKTFNVIGNHDLYNSGWDSFEEYSYPYTSFYKFRTESFTMYFLDSASGSLGNTQLMAFKHDMENNENGRKKIVFTHIPAYAGGLFYFVMQNTTERNKFISYCAKNDVQALIVGHTHKEITSDIGFKEYNLPGYLEKRGFGILTVNEEAGTVSSRCVYYE